MAPLRQSKLMGMFGLRSKQRLQTCEPRLRTLMNEVVQIIDCTIIEGARTDEQQALYFDTGRSKLDGVTRKSKHQVDDENPLARAVDAGPYYADEFPKIPWDLDTQDNRLRWYFFQGIVLGCASRLGIPVRLGLDWDGDRRFNDQSFHDLPHIELDD